MHFCCPENYVSVLPFSKYDVYHTDFGLELKPFEFCLGRGD